jgi:hypothetical protein
VPTYRRATSPPRPKAASSSTESLG